MIIDVHIHPFCKEATVTPNFDDAYERMMAASRNKERAEAAKAMFSALFTSFSIKDIISAMDLAGIDKACIVAMDMTTHYGVRLVTNDDLGRFAQEYPDRFIPFAGVDPGQGRAAVDELRRAVSEYGCRGVKLVPPVQHFDFSDPKYYPLWETALELDLVVWTHCAHQVSHPDSDARLGHPMLVEPVAHQFPDLKIVLGHCGFPWHWEAWSLVVRHPNVYLDVSAYPQLYNHFPWDAYSKSQAEHKLMFATDFPLYSFQDTLSALEKVDISDDFRNKILGENAARLLNL